MHHGLLIQRARVMEQATVPIRRFERGASIDGARNMLTEMGYRIRQDAHGTYRVWKPGQRGRGTPMRIRKFLKLIDDIRVKCGQEPFLKRA